MLNCSRPAVAGLLVLALSAVAQADRAADMAAIRQVLLTIEEGWQRGDTTRTLPNLDSSFAGYFAANGRFELAAVSHVGHQSLRAQRRPAAADTVDSAYAPPHFEVLHIDVKGDHAIALPQYARTTRSAEAGQSYTDEWQSVWLLRRAGSSWKAYAILARTSSSTSTVPMGPRPLFLGMCDLCYCVPPTGYCLKPSGEFCNYQYCSACRYCRQ